MTVLQKCGDLVSRRIRHDASLRDIAEVVDALSELLAKGESGDHDSFARYQDITYSLHTVREPRLRRTCRTITDHLYPVEEGFIPVEKLERLLPIDDFRGQVDEIIRQQSRVRHPMSMHLYEGEPTHQQLRRFLYHHWLRSSAFFSLIATFAARLDDIREAASLYQNLYEEAGEGDISGAHPLLLQKLLRYFDVPCDFGERSDMPEEQAYLNNRIRCVRTLQPGWGLAVLFAIEDVTSGNHRKIYELLRRREVPHEYCRFHEIHGTVDEAHAGELWELVAIKATNVEFQQAFLTSLQHHFRVNRRYFDALWKSMQALG